MDAKKKGESAQRVRWWPVALGNALEAMRSERLNSDIMGANAGVGTTAGLADKAIK